jgi:hypothetical protein
MDPDRLLGRRCRGLSAGCDLTTLGGCVARRGELEDVAACRSGPSRFSFGVGVGDGRILAGGPPKPSDTDPLRRSFGVAHAGSTLITDRMGKTRSEGSFWTPCPSWWSEEALKDDIHVGESEKMGVSAAPERLRFPGVVAVADEVSRSSSLAKGVGKS